MAINLNVDISALFKKTFSSSGQGASLGSHTKPIAMGGTVLLVASLYVVFIAIPKNAENTAMEAKAQSIEDLRNEQTLLGKQRIKTKADLAQEIDKNKQLTARFNTEQEIEAFYDNLGQLAIQNGLTINGLKRGTDKPIYTADEQPSTNTSAAAAAAPTPTDNAPKGKALFNKMPFELELSGTFMGYYRFLGALTRFPKQVQIDKLNVSLIPNDRRGRVKIQASLSALSWVPPTTPSPTLRPPAPVILPPAPAIPPPNAGQHGMFHHANLILDSERPDPSGLVLVAAKALDSTAKPSPIQQKAAMPTGTPLPPPPPQDPIRDPFARNDSPSLSGQSAPAPNPGAPNPSGIEAHTVSGVIIGPQGRAALVQTPQGETLIVKVGNPLGSRKTKVIEITESGIVVQDGKRKVPLSILSISPSTAKEISNVAQNPQNP